MSIINQSKLNNFILKAIEKKINMKENIILKKHDENKEVYELKIPKDQVEIYAIIDLTKVNKDILQYTSLHIQKEIIKFKILDYEEYSFKQRNYIMDILETIHPKKITEIKRGFKTEHMYRTQMINFMESFKKSKKNCGFKELYKYAMENIIPHLEKVVEKQKKKQEDSLILQGVNTKIHN